MEIRLNRPGLDDGGFFEYAEGSASFFSTLSNPHAVAPQDVNKALDWLMSLVIVPDKEDEEEYKAKVEKVVRGYSFNELVELLTIADTEPDPK